MSDNTLPTFPFIQSISVDENNHLVVHVSAEDKSCTAQNRQSRLNALVREGLASSCKEESATKCYTISDNNSALNFIDLLEIEAGVKRGSDNFGFSKEGDPLVKDVEMLGSIKKQLENIQTTSV